MGKTQLGYIALLTIGYFCFLSAANAQVGITAVPFLQINNHARSMGMAGATVALRYHSAGIHLNPAVTGKPDNVKFTGQFSQHPDPKGEDPKWVVGTPWLQNFDTDLRLYMPAISFSKNHWSFAYQHTLLDLGEQMITSPTGEYEGTFSSYERAHTLTAAYHWNRYISTGIGLNFIKSKLVPTRLEVGDQKAQPGTATTVDLGLYGAYPYEFMEDYKVVPSVGWSLTDFGDDGIQYSVSATKDPLPIMMRGGFGLRLDYQQELTDMPVIKGKNPLSIGLYRSYSKILARYDDRGKPMGPWQALFNSWGSYYRYNGQEKVRVSPAEQIMHHSGIEVTLFELISFRHGYYREDKQNGDRRYHTFGFGLHYEIFSLDYISYDLDEGGHPLEDTAYYQFSISIPGEWLTNLMY